MRTPPSRTPIDAASGADEAVHAHRLGALVGLGEELHEQSERHRLDDRAADPLHRARGDQRQLRVRDAARERRAGEQDDADHEDAPVPVQVTEPAAEEEEAAAGEQVGVEDPNQRRLAEAEVGADRRQRDVDDGRVEHDHEHAETDDGEREPAARSGDRGHGESGGGDRAKRRMVVAGRRARAAHPRSGARRLPAPARAQLRDIISPRVLLPPLAMPSARPSTARQVRRRVIGTLAAAPLAFGGAATLPLFAQPTAASAGRRVRPGDPDWPSDAEWQRLNAAVGGALVKVASSVRRLPCRAALADVRGAVSHAAEPVGDRRRRRHDAGLRLGRRVDLVAERLRRGRAPRGRRRRRRRLRARTARAPRRQGRRPQLPGHVQRARFAPGVDAAHERGDARRSLRSGRLRRPHRAAARGALRRGRGVGARLRRRDDARRRLRAGGRLHDRGRRGVGAKRRLRQLLEGVRHRRRQPARGRGRDRRRQDPRLQRLQRRRSVLGAQGRRRRQLRRRHATDAARASAAGDLRRRQPHRQGRVRRGVSQADRPHARLLREFARRPALGRADPLPRATTRCRSRWCSRA